MKYLYAQIDLCKFRINKVPTGQTFLLFLSRVSSQALMLNQHFQKFCTDAHKNPEVVLNSYCFQADIYKYIFIVTKLQPHTYLKWQESKKKIFV